MTEWTVLKRRVKKKTERYKRETRKKKYTAEKKGYVGRKVAKEIRNHQVEMALTNNLKNTFNVQNTYVAVARKWLLDYLPFTRNPVLDLRFFELIVAQQAYNFLSALFFFLHLLVIMGKKTVQNL